MVKGATKLTKAKAVINIMEIVGCYPGIGAQGGSKLEWMLAVLSDHEGIPLMNSRSLELSYSGSGSRKLIDSCFQKVQNLERKNGHNLKWLNICLILPEVIDIRGRAMLRGIQTRWMGSYFNSWKKRKNFLEESIIQPWIVWRYGCNRSFKANEKKPCHVKFI